MVDGKLTSNLIRDVGVDKKLGVLIFLMHLDVCLRRAYAKLKRRIGARCLSAEDEREAEHGSIDLTVRRSRPNWNCVPEPGFGWRVYRRLTTTFHACNSLKYGLILVALDGSLIPMEANCYLLGRIFGHYQVVEYLNILAFSVLLFILAWRYTLLVRDYSPEMDILVFLMHDRETIRLEMRKIAELNEAIKFKAIHGGHLFPQNILQKVLFYELDDGNNIGSAYRLRPNRTEQHRRRLHSHLDRMVFSAIILVVCFVVIVAPLALVGILTDATFIRAYPGCCPVLERMHLNASLKRTQVSFDLCPTKRASILFDLLDNAVLNFDSYMVLILPLGLAALISDDLGAYWRIIDKKASHLAGRMKLRDSLYPSMDKPLSKTLDVSDFIEDRPYLVAHAPSNGGHIDTDNHVCELQALLCDFFDCIGRADKIVNLLLSSSLGFYIMSILVFGYFGWKIDGLYNLMIARFLFVMIILTFVAGCSVALRLKRMIDGSYVNLCSIMAHDRSNKKLKWRSILECYTFKARNSFTVFRSIKFTWMFVLNLVASSMSFLVAVATLKEQKT